MRSATTSPPANSGAGSRSHSASASECTTERPASRTANPKRWRSPITLSLVMVVLPSRSRGSSTVCKRSAGRLISAACSCRSIATSTNQWTLMCIAWQAQLVTSASKSCVPKTRATVRPSGERAAARCRVGVSSMGLSSLERGRTTPRPRRARDGALSPKASSVLGLSAVSAVSSAAACQLRSAAWLGRCRRQTWRTRAGPHARGVARARRLTSGSPPRPPLPPQCAHCQGPPRPLPRHPSLPLHPGQTRGSRGARPRRRRHW